MDFKARIRFIGHTGSSPFRFGGANATLARKRRRDRFDPGFADRGSTNSELVADTEQRSRERLSFSTSCWHLGASSAVRKDLADDRLR
jgi:hypothetical protein